MPYYMPVGLINGHLVCYYMMYCAGPRASKPCWLSTLNYRVCSICLSFLCIVYNTKLQHTAFIHELNLRVYDMAGPQMTLCTGCCSQNLWPVWFSARRTALYLIRFPCNFLFSNLFFFRPDWTLNKKSYIVYLELTQ